MLQTVESTEVRFLSRELQQQLFNDCRLVDRENYNEVQCTP